MALMPPDAGLALTGAGSWIASANDPRCDFPLGNLPYGAFSLRGTGEMRKFLEDGKTVILHGSAQKDGMARIGFGACTGTVVAGDHGR